MGAKVISGVACATNKGGFIKPNCTLDEMKKIVDDALVENGNGRIMGWMAKKQLPHLDRWKG